jgi:hypothetical protein
MNAVFQSEKLFDENVVMNADSGIGTDWRALARFPFRLILETGRFGSLVPRGALGIALLLAIPFALCLRGLGTAPIRLCFAASVVYLLLIFYTMQYARFVIPILPVICVLGAAAVVQILQSPLLAFIGRICLLISLLFQPLATSLQYANFEDRFPVKAAFGLEDRETFLRRALHGYSAANHLNSVTKSGEKVLSVDTEYLRYYVKPRLESLSLSLRRHELRAIAETGPKVGSPRDCAIPVIASSLSIVQLLPTRHHGFRFSALRF